MQTNKVRTFYMILAAIIGWFGLALQFYLLMTKKDSGIDAGGRFFNFFSYFTILTNILAALSFTIPLINVKSKAGQFLSNPVVQSGTTLYILVVGLVYATVLQKLWQPQGLQWLADVILHYAMPVIYAIFWLLFIPQGSLKWKHSLQWAIFPVIYFVYSIIRGAFTKWYPYPFIDVKEHGYLAVVRNAGILLAGFIIFGLIFISLDKIFARKPVRK